MSPRRANPRLAAAALALGVVTSASYALQRLWSAWVVGESGVIVQQVHVPYYWRCDLALVHGLLAALLVGLGVGEVGAGRLLRASPWIVLGVVGPSAVAMVLVP